MVARPQYLKTRRRAPGSQPADSAAVGDMAARRPRHVRARIEAGTGLGPAGQRVAAVARESAATRGVRGAGAFPSACVRPKRLHVCGRWRAEFRAVPRNASDCNSVATGCGGATPTGIQPYHPVLSMG